jgi:hypothetical protein
VRLALTLSTVVAMIAVVGLDPLADLLDLLDYYLHTSFARQSRKRGLGGDDVGLKMGRICGVGRLGILMVG